MTAAAFAYLTGRSLVNRLARQAAQLRSPRYLIALLLGAGYVGYVLFREHPARATAAIDPGWVELIGVLVLLFLMAWSWIVGVEQRALAFSPAEVTLLFPAPITRRALVHYKLLRSQAVILVNTLLWMFLLRRGFGAVPPLLRAVALWTMLSTLSLHRLGASLVRTSLAEHGWAAVRRRLPTVALLTLAVGGIAWTIIQTLPVLRDARQAGAGAVLDALAIALSAPLPSVLLWPLRALVHPLSTTTSREWLQAMGPAVLVLCAHYLWVVRSDTAFEEAAAEASLAEAQRRGASGTLRPPGARRDRPISPPLVALSPIGWPAGAILWKNVTAVLRRRRARNLAVAFVLAGGLAAAGSFRGQGGLAEFAAALALTWFGFVFCFGPQWIRNDLRSDLLRMDLLRAFPVRGWAIVTAETLASTFALTLVELGMLGFAYLALLGNSDVEVPADERTVVLCAAVLLVPPITFTAMLLQNGAALLYPAWVRLGGAQRGVEALGQNLLATVAFALLLGLILAGPAVAGWLVFHGLTPAVEAWALAPALLAGFALLAGELALLVHWLGQVFERTDAASIPA
jgi:hypothetical protein